MKDLAVERNGCRAGMLDGRTAGGARKVPIWEVAPLTVDELRAAVVTLSQSPIDKNPSLRLNRIS